MSCKRALSLGIDDSIIVLPLFSYDIIDLDLTLGKLNLRRCDSDAVYERYFSKLKCLLDRFFNLRHFCIFRSVNTCGFKDRVKKNNLLMGTETKSTF